MMAEKPPLENIRIIDLSRVWSGPMAVRMLADLGAEVILIDAPQTRIKSKESLELLKQAKHNGRYFPYLPAGDPGDDPWNRQGTYNDFNRNKLGITMDLTKMAGQELFKRLVKISDVVVENYTPRVMKNFGLDYPVLQTINPRIVMISLPGYGMSGPYRDFPAYGTTLEQHAGFSSVMGYPDSGPYRTQSTYADPVASVTAASAIMLALIYRNKVGKGQYIDLAQIESSICLLGELILDYEMNGRNPKRMGNRHASMAPHGCYRCKGNESWITIAISSNEEWLSLCKALGNPKWVQEERFSSQTSRWHNQDELDRLIENWTVNYNNYELMNLLQHEGVPTGAVLNAKELVENAHLDKRDYFVKQDHPSVGIRPYPGLPFKFSDIQPTYYRPAPRVDEHTEYVFGNLLGISHEEIEILISKHVIGNNSG